MQTISHRKKELLVCRLFEKASENRWQICLHAKITQWGDLTTQGFHQRSFYKWPLPVGQFPTTEPIKSKETLFGLNWILQIAIKFNHSIVF